MASKALATYTFPGSMPQIVHRSPWGYGWGEHPSRAAYGCRYKEAMPGTKQWWVHLTAQAMELWVPPRVVLREANARWRHHTGKSPLKGIGQVAFAKLLLTPFRSPQDIGGRLSTAIVLWTVGHKRHRAWYQDVPGFQDFVHRIK